MSERFNEHCPTTYHRVGGFHSIEASNLKVDRFPGKLLTALKPGAGKYAAFETPYTMTDRECPEHLKFVEGTIPQGATAKSPHPLLAVLSTFANDCLSSAGLTDRQSHKDAGRQFVQCSQLK